LEFLFKFSFGFSKTTPQALSPSDVYPITFEEFNVGGSRTLPEGVRISGHDRQNKLVSVAQGDLLFLVYFLSLFF
jgi:hypothetical protein